MHDDGKQEAAEPKPEKTEPPVAIPEPHEQGDENAQPN